MHCGGGFSSSDISHVLTGGEIPAYAFHWLSQGKFPLRLMGIWSRGRLGSACCKKENSHVYDGLFGIGVPHTDLQLDIKKKKRKNSTIRNLQCKHFIKHWHFKCSALQLRCATVCFKEHVLGFLSLNPIQILILNNKFLDASLYCIFMGAFYMTTFWALYDTPLWCA